MTRAVQLNNVEHAALRVHRGRSAAMGDAVMSAPVFPHEFRRAGAHYPIVFSRSEDGAYRPLALFGLEAGENLFLDAERWDAAYVPLAVRAAPFLIGRDRQGGLEVHVDLDHPRVGAEGGEPMFLPQGGQAPALHEAAKVLGDVAAGDEAARSFCALLAEMSLLEPFTLDVTMEDSSEGRLAGLHVVHEERVASLTADELGRLQAADALMPLFMAIASLSRFEDLARRRNARLWGAP